MLQTDNNCARILKFLSDNFGTGIPNNRIRACLEIAGSVDELENALRFLEKKAFIDVVAMYNPGSGKMVNYPVLKEKTQRMIKLYGIEEMLRERKPVKW